MMSSAQRSPPSPKRMNYICCRWKWFSLI
jgi:hypothetical protein